jgi:hypothetical protein
MNVDQIRKKLQDLNKKTNKRKDIWKAKDKHTIRLLPYPHGDEPIIELGFHYDVGDNFGLLCPRSNFSKDCVICDYADKLKSWNDEDGAEKPESVRKADFEIFKKVQVKETWLVPMIERGQEGEGPKFFKLNKTNCEKVWSLCLDEEMAEIAEVEPGLDVLFNVNTAFDLTIEFKQPNNKDGKGNIKSFPVTDLDKKMRPSKLAKTKGEVDAILEKVPNVRDVYPEVPSEEIQKAFEQFINSESAEAKPDGGKEYKANTAEKPNIGGRTIDEVFSDIAD